MSTKESYLNKVNYDRPNTALRQFAYMLELKDGIIETLNEIVVSLREKNNQLQIIAEDEIEKNMPEIAAPISIRLIEEALKL